MPGPDFNSCTDEIILDESSNNDLAPNVDSISASPPYFREDEARELAKVIRRMQAADQRYREESEFLLLRNEVALHTLFQDNKSTMISHSKWDDHFHAKGGAGGGEAEKLCFQETKSDKEEEKMATVYSVAFDNGLRAHDQTTPQSLDVQIIEDRIDKARLDLSFLEQQTTQMEIEMKTLQMELAKLKDQLCQTQI